MAQRIKLEVPRDQRIPAIGEQYAGGVVVTSFPEIGNPNIIVEVPDQLAANVEPFAVDSRPEHDDYRVLWVTGPAPLQASAAAVGDTFPAADLLARGRFGKGITLGIVDSGLDRGHVAFDGCTLVAASGPQDFDDRLGHGTHVASTAASAWGIAKQATIVSARALTSAFNNSEADIANAIRAVAERGAQVVNLSLGGSVSSVIDAACDFARSRGALVIAAAGNDPAAQVGSPARAADVIVLACDRNRDYFAQTSGRQWVDINRLTDIGVDVAAAASGTRDQARVASGTSMAAPHISGKAALLLAAGLGRFEVIHYLFAHRSSPPEVGLVIMLPDYGGDGTVIVGPLRGADTILAEAIDTADAAGHEFDLGLQALQAGDPAAALPHLRAARHGVSGGPGGYVAVLDLMWKAREALPTAPPVTPPPAPLPAPEPAPTPPPAPVAQLGGFYGRAHWDGDARAIDWYPGPLGTPIAWPIGGEVRRQSTFGPMDATQPAPLGTNILTALLHGDDGWLYGFSHVLGDIREGRVEAGQPFAQVGNSGIEMLPGNPAHIHFFAVSPGAQPSFDGKGNVSAADVLQRLGFPAQAVERIPSPQDYLNRRAEAGRLLS